MIPVAKLLEIREDYTAKCQSIKDGDDYPFYSWCCKNVDGYKTLRGNLVFRKRILELCSENLEFKNDLYAMCSRDLLFYINTFCFTFDPRLIPQPTEVPFITYDYQDVAFDEIKDAIQTGFDELTEKSRDMGASWMYLTVFQWFWQFKPYLTFRLLSRNEDLVDKTDDPDCLFWKISYLISHLPRWLAPNHKQVHLSFFNEDNNSTMNGCTTTSDAARGGRCTAMLPDEFAAVPDGHGMLKSTRDVTPCRLFNSTHQGAATAFYKLSIGLIKKLVIHWSVHPEKSKGLYYADNGKLIRMDDYRAEVSLTREKFNYPDNYPFRLDGKLRSPWYDNECDRAAHPMEIAQELDIDPFSSDFQYFDPLMILKIDKENTCHPFAEGTLEFDNDSLDPIGFIEGKNGPLKLWVYPDYQNKISRNLEIGAGFDISAGTGASNSTASFVNLRTGEKIAEYADPWIKPESFAKAAIAMCRYFNDAFMVPDGAGPGRTFCDEIIRLGYRNLYYRRNEEGLNKTISDKPGVFLNPKEKAAILGLYRRNLKDATYIQRSSPANQECLQYIFTTGGAIEHSSAMNSIDPSGAGASHGDRVIADALAAKCMDFIGKQAPALQEDKTPLSCPGARREAYDAKRRNNDDW